jgi:NTP pyrophosphatase (non-canonical NTP hydrolase)
MELRDFQDVIARTYLERDSERGVPVTIAWLAEEVGELARAVRKGTREEQVLEMGDVLAWLASLANQLGIDFDEAIAHFVDGCPKCSAIPCACP